jgi:hypothetical protein
VSFGYRANGLDEIHHHARPAFDVRMEDAQARVDPHGNEGELRFCFQKPRGVVDQSVDRIGGVPGQLTTEKPESTAGSEKRARRQKTQKHHIVPTYFVRAIVTFLLKRCAAESVGR